MKFQLVKSVFADINFIAFRLLNVRLLRQWCTVIKSRWPGKLTRDASFHQGDALSACKSVDTAPAVCNYASEMAGRLTQF